MLLVLKDLVMCISHYCDIYKAYLAYLSSQKVLGTKKFKTCELIKRW